MRLLSWKECLALALISMLIFGIGAIIASVTYAPSPLLWTRDCSIAGAQGKVNLTCGDHEQRVNGVSSMLTLALQDKNIPIKCSARKTRSPIDRLSVECGGETP